MGQQGHLPHRKGRADVHLERLLCLLADVGYLHEFMDTGQQSHWLWSDGVSGMAPFVQTLSTVAE